MRRLFHKKIRTHNPKHEWLEKDYPGSLHLIFMQGIHAGTWESRQLYPFGFKTGYVFCGQGRLDWFWDARELRRVRAIFLKKSKRDLKFFLRIYQRWQRDHERAITILEQALRVRLPGLTDHALLRLYRNVYARHVRQGASGYLADAFLSSEKTDWLAEFIAARVGRRADLSDIMQRLTAAVIPTYSNQAEIALAKLAKGIDKKFNNFGGFQTYVSHHTTLKAKIVTYTRQYYWLENNYYPKTLRELDFTKKLYRLLKTKQVPDTKVRLQKNQQAKQGLLKELNDPYLTNVITMVELATHMQDYRKMAVVRFTYFMHEVFAEMSKRTSLTVEDYRNTVEPELEDIFLRGKINREKLRTRAVKNFAAAIAQGYVVYEGEDLTRYVTESEFRQTHNTVREIRGVSASPGLYRGIVRIVKDPHRARGFKRGEVLVTNNTTPEFVPLMKKAGAIVTEQGGITTHAAIVSRELGVPCVIGTKIATKIFKDGDMVEVDANRGIIKRLP